VVFNQLHTGSIGGLLLRILYFLAAIIGGLLPWSGYYMWWKRTHPQRKKETDNDSIKAADGNEKDLITL
ncbi:MAG: PepSY domain-containing protein, partial [Bacteroidaceae bacterium]|nr:PepSY domain-containing protein [Bacteroidaceae bacterium]